MFRIPNPCYIVRIPRMTFSTDGHFFACSTTRSDVYLWKETPTGYTLHQTLKSNTVRSRPLLSRNGESIALFGGSAIRYDLSVYHRSTGERLSCNLNLGGVVWFTPGERDLWFAMGSSHTVTLRECNRWKMIMDANHGIGIGHPPEGCPWDHRMVTGLRTIGG